MQINEVWVSLLGQAPLVGIFVWAMLMVMDKFNRFQMEIMRQWNEKQAQRDEMWRRFLDEQRRANNEALARLAEEMKAMRAELAAHDGRITGHLERWEEANEV